MDKHPTIWLCPLCEARQIAHSSCMLCDTYGFITDMEMAHYERLKSKKASLGVLTLDLSEFE